MQGMPAREASRLDFDEEGRKLMASLTNIGSGSSSLKFNPMDAIWRDQSTGGTIFVGNQSAAQGPASALFERGITHVVNCTDDMPNYCEAAPTEPPHPTASHPRIKYLRFNVTFWCANSSTASALRVCPHVRLLRILSHRSAHMSTQ